MEAHPRPDEALSDKEAAALIDARWRSLAHPSNEGDLTIANRRVSLR